MSNFYNIILLIKTKNIRLEGPVKVDASGIILFQGYERTNKMKIKCGIDIIEIKRIKESIETLGDKFIERVFTKAEIEYCESKNSQKYQHYAARFATKEAVYKAVSYVLNDANALSWQDIEVKNDKTGKPIVKISEEKLNPNLIDDIDISISHCKEYACASAVILFK